MPLGELREEHLFKIGLIVLKILFLFLSYTVKKVSSSYDLFLSCKKLFKKCIFVVKWGNTKTCANTMRELEKLRAHSFPSTYRLHLMF